MSRSKGLRFLRVGGGRLLHLAIVLFLVSVGTFMLLHLTPGNPAITILGNSATPQAVKEIDDKLGLNQPLLVQYGHWISHVLTGNLGNSLVPPYSSVTSRISLALPVTLELTILALLMGLALSIPIGVWSAYREGGWFDRSLSGASFGLLSVPGFVTGLVLALLLALYIHAFPRTEWVPLSEGLGPNLSHAFLPALTLALPLAAIYSRILRGEIIQTLREDYILFARAKGLPRGQVMMRYAMRPSSVTLVTLSGVTLGALLGGTLIVETIYALPGMGNLLVMAVSDNDYPLVQGIVLVIAVTFVLANLVVDLSYGFLDPRTRRGRL